MIEASFFLQCLLDFIIIVFIELRFWDSRTENAISEIVLDGKITSMSLSLDGNKLLCCCRDETLSLFDLRVRHVEHIYRLVFFIQTIL